jgi:hypothetical protein
MSPTIINNSCVCVCARPPIVDLASPLDLASSSKNEQLRENLCRFGWSHVTMNVAQLLNIQHQPPNTITTQHLHLENEIASFFDDSVVQQELLSANSVCQYFRSESGAADNGAVEAKQSWQLIKQDTHQLPVTNIAAKLLPCMSALHEVAVAVQRALQLPDTVQLLSDADRLRAFYYDTATTTTTQTEESFGSNAHTDWGTLTVVYQDNVGGLQTYCNECDAWVNVDTAATTTTGEDTTTTVPFVVHVGDTLSLAIQKAAATTARHEETRVSFPSPKHRVVSPTTEKRTSLIYFAYLPERQSIQSLTMALEPWTREHKVIAPLHIPYQDYFLLRNQSARNDTDVILSARTQLDAIWKLPLEDVIRNKWKQVQR